MPEMFGKSRNGETLCFSNICGSGSKSRLARAAGVERCGQRNEKLHAAVARRAFPIQNV